MKSVLVVVDMQNDFIDGVLGSEYNKNVVLPNVVKLINNFVASGNGIVFTRDTHILERDKETIEALRIPQHCILNTNGWEIHKDIQEIFSDIGSTPGVYTINKDSFGSLNELAKYVNLFNIDKDTEIHICGLCTDICVVSNALILRACFPKTKIIVHSDACGGTTPEAHNSALTVMKSCLVDIV